MENDIRLITKSLNTLKSLYEEIVTLSEQKRQAIVKNDVNSLSFIVEKEKELIKQISDIEDIRKQCSARIGAELGIGYKITLRQIIENIEENKEDLITILDELTKVMDKLKQLNQINTSLVKAQLNYIDCFKSAFFEDGINNYSAEGREPLDKKQATNIFDRMV